MDVDFDDPEYCSEFVKGHFHFDTHWTKFHVQGDQKMQQEMEFRN